ncbi:hypothetical protein EIP86_011098 [Pleurotus ostreatoroseus]|nr:hypothetical protein EIP86_011098 [Pleurotus ostreatoroseus]
MPANIPAPQNLGPWMCSEAVTVYTDGACIRGGAADAVAGCGAWFGHDDPCNISIRLPETLPQTNQAAEIAAVLATILTVPSSAPLHIISDSRYVTDGLTLLLPDWEARGWIGVRNSELIQATVSRLRKRTAVTTFTWVKGHSGVAGSEGADHLAGLAAQKPDPDTLDISIDHRFIFSGAALAGLAQGLAYRGIRDRDHPVPRRCAAANIKAARSALAVLGHSPPTDAALWSSLRRRDVRRPLGTFLWKAIHGVLKCGPYWASMPNLADRARCTVCPEAEESIFQCAAPERETVWKLVRAAWTKHGRPWPNLSMGLVYTSTATRFSTHDDRPDRAADRLFLFLVAESAFLLWKLRCERHIQDQGDTQFAFSAAEVRNRWTAMMNEQLTLDRTLARRSIFGRRALPSSVVLATWRGPLQDERALPDFRIFSPRILVGITAAE